MRSVNAAQQPCMRLAPSVPTNLAPDCSESTNVTVRLVSRCLDAGRSGRVLIRTPGREALANRTRSTDRAMSKRAWMLAMRTDDLIASIRSVLIVLPPTTSPMHALRGVSTNILEGKIIQPIGRRK